jgi:transposase
VKAAREHWIDGQNDLEPERLIFIDESGLSTKLARLRGWAPKGERCRGAIPHGHWKTITFVGGLTLTGFVAPMLLDGPMNGECFLAWVEQMLAPTLQPGHVVVMDNLPAHKVAGVSQPIEARGAKLLYLPPYSPDFNPIENAFAKFKALVRMAAARTFDLLETAAANALQQFKPLECANLFAHAGYGLN